METLRIARRTARMIVYVASVGTGMCLNSMASHAVAALAVDPANRIALAVGPGNETNPDIDGQIVVWADYQSNSGTIYAKDISDPNASARALNPGGSGANPRISGNTVVLYDPFSCHVYAFDLADQQSIPRQLTSAPSQDGMLPAISGNLVV
jgi:beta propeller repeat protein